MRLACACAFAVAIAAVLVSPADASQGVLSYAADDMLLVGRLGAEAPNHLSDLTRLQRKGGADVQLFAVDRGGRVIGACRTTHFRGAHALREQVDGAMDLATWDLSGRMTAEETQDTLLRKIDGREGTSLRSQVMSDRARYLDCYRVGSSGRNSRLVFYFEPRGFEAERNHFAIEVQVRGNSFSITEFESFNPAAGPTRVVARENPLKGNTVDVVDGQIQVNGMPVLRHGKPLDASEVRYQFK